MSNGAKLAVSEHTEVPGELLELAGLRPGDEARAEVTEQGLLIRPLTATEQIDAEIAAGTLERFDSDAALDAWLDQPDVA